MGKREPHIVSFIGTALSCLGEHQRLQMSIPLSYGSVQRYLQGQSRFNLDSSGCRCTVTQELSYRKQIARQLRTQHVEGI